MDETNNDVINLIDRLLKILWAECEDYVRDIGEHFKL